MWKNKESVYKNYQKFYMYCSRHLNVLTPEFYKRHNKLAKSLQYLTFHSLSIVSRTTRFVALSTFTNKEEHLKYHQQFTKLYITDIFIVKLYRDYN